MRKIIQGALALAAGAALAAALVAMLGGTAQAVEGGPYWHANPGATITEQNAVVLTGGQTSVEAVDLPLVIAADDTVASFVYTLAGGATCTAGAPRVFFTVGGQTVNSWDQLQPSGAQCGEPVGTQDARKVSFKLPAGEVTAAGIVYDNGQAGVVTVKDLTVDGTALNLLDRPHVPTSPSATPTTQPSSPSPKPTETVSPSPTSAPTRSPSTSPSPSQAPTTTAAPEPTATTTSAPPMAAAGNDLPVTGPSGIPTLALWGIGLVGVGAFLMVGTLVYRRRQDRFEA